MKNKVRLNDTKKYYELFLEDYIYFTPLTETIVTVGDMIEDTAEYILVEIIHADGGKGEETFDKLYIAKEYTDMGKNSNHFIVIAGFEFYLKTDKQQGSWLEVLDARNRNNRASISIETMEVVTAFVSDKQRLEKLNEVLIKNKDIIFGELTRDG